jgi:hypothetical protein
MEGIGDVRFSLRPLIIEWIDNDRVQWSIIKHFHQLISRHPTQPFGTSRRLTLQTRIRQSQTS